MRGWRRRISAVSVIVRSRSPIGMGLVLVFDINSLRVWSRSTTAFLLRPDEVLEHRSGYREFAVSSIADHLRLSFFDNLPETWQTRGALAKSTHVDFLDDRRACRALFLPVPFRLRVGRDFNARMHAALGLVFYDGPDSAFRPPSPSKSHCIPDKCLSSCT